nr:MAG: dinitrogenase iron-molybdenum cofactor biosynthesis protein [Thermoproteus sp. AZ2]
MKIAIAVSREGLVFPGHFAHAPKFRIYEYADGKLRLLEERDNPLGNAPDLDVEHHGAHMHGVAKYSWLRQRVLPDVDAVIAAGACETSHRYFTSEGVKMLFTDPIEVKVLEDYIDQNPSEFEEVLRQS